MKKLFQLGAVFFSILITQAGYAQNTTPQQTNLNPTTPPSYSQDHNHGYGEHMNKGASQTGQYQGHDQHQGYDQNNGYSQSGQYQGYGQAQGYGQGQGFARNSDGSYSGDCCPEDHPCQDTACNDCWSLYCHYEPCYYTTKRCVEEQVPCKKRCCRMCPKYYEVTRCKYVPQYYTETVCCQEPEYYDVDDCKTCKRWVCERQCKYVPQYYWKHTCGKTECDSPCPR